MRTAVGWLFGVLFWFAPGQTTDLWAKSELEQQLKQEQAALDSLKAKLAADETRLRQTRLKQQTETKALGQLEREILRTKGEVRTMYRRERALSTRLLSTRELLGAAEARLQVREAGMAHRLRDMYKLGRRGTLEVLFSSESFSEAMKRLRYLSRVAEQDRRDYRAILTERKRVGNLYALQSTQYQHQQALVKGKRQQEGSLKELVSQKSQTLKHLQTDALARERAIRNIKKEEAESVRQISELIQKLQEEQRRGQRLAELPPFDCVAHKGKLRRPVPGKFITRFGRQQDAELKTWTFNRGVNLAAPEGTEVRAVAPGEVVLVDWFPGYGRFVLLRHPDDFFTLYGHLNSDLVTVGEILAEGTVIGTVGSTGRLDGNRQLHFEIMRGEAPLDPAEWLGK